MSGRIEAIARQVLRRCLVTLGVCVSLTKPVLAQDPAAQLQVCGLEAGPMVQLDQVIDGRTVRTADGSVIRLVGLQAPNPPLGLGASQAWPRAEQAKSRLEALGAGPYQLFFGDMRKDRHGRILGHLIGASTDQLGQSDWVEAVMLRAGLARVDAGSTNRQCVARLYEFERYARSNEIGIWADPYYQVRRASNTATDIDSIQLVEGKVLSAASTRSGMYLNFGRSWRTDFTVLIAPPYFGPFEEAGFDPLVLEEKYIRVRGWIAEENGPMIRATHPEQIEILGATPKTPSKTEQHERIDHVGD